jgi:phage tail-like protein
MPAESERRDPFLAFRFEVQLSGLPSAGFSECSGLTFETEVQDYPEGGRNDVVHKLVGRTKQSNVTLKRGIVDRVLWDWYADLMAGRVVPRNVTVRVRTTDGAATAAEWQLDEALPVKWTGPDLNAGQSGVAV